MKVRVRLFAAAKQFVGRDAVEVEVPEPVTVARLREVLHAEHPELRGILRQAMIAVNMEYAGDAAAIPPSAEVACIPPVSGG